MMAREVGKGGNSAKKVGKKGAFCGLVENKESKTMLLLFLHSSYRKIKGNKPEGEYTGNKKKLQHLLHFSIT